jgi:hypothetical protein
VVTGTWHRITQRRAWIRPRQRPNLYIGPARFAGGEGMPDWRTSSLLTGGVYASQCLRAPAFIDGRLEHRPRSTLRPIFGEGCPPIERPCAARPAPLALIAPWAPAPEDWPAILLDATRLAQIVGLLSNPDWRLVFADRERSSRAPQGRPSGLPAASLALAVSARWAPQLRDVGLLRQVAERAQTLLVSSSNGTRRSVLGSRRRRASRIGFHAPRSPGCADAAREQLAALLGSATMSKRRRIRARAVGGLQISL